MIRTAESVSPMHPDKMCDRISDAILDAALKDDNKSRCAIETMGGHGIVSVTGEVTTRSYVNLRDIVNRIVVQKVGVQTNIVRQSSDIARGVETGGAGDQGIMTGYACAENEAMIPQEAFLSRTLCQHIFHEYPYDGKTQITLNVNNEIEAVVASFQNSTNECLAELTREWAAKNNLILPEKGLYFNPAGEWEIGGFEADTGLTGRKLIIDNYGPRIPIGGGANSGKDATKVDRGAAYMARKIAVDLLHQHGAEEVFVYLAYAIGVAHPVMAIAKIDGKDEKITGYDLRPQGIIDFLGLDKPIFEKTAEWGHYGNGFAWDLK
jgi:S-adenosylmethionine synthetase